MTTTMVAVEPERGLRGFVQRHPYATFLLIFNTFGQALAFIPVVASRVYGVELNRDIALIIPTLLFLLLPALAITRIARGGPAFHELIRSMFRFRVQVRWYLLPLLAMPALSLIGALPAPPGLTVGGVLAGYVTAYLPALLFQFVTTNWWEETAWMGFFQVPLQRRFGPWRAVLLTTPFFALEHISLVFGGTFSQGLIQFGLITLVIIPTRALLAWIYNRTGSIALVGLVHAASNAGTFGLVTQLWGHSAGGGVAVLVVGLVVIAATRGRLGWTGSPGPFTNRPRPSTTEEWSRSR